MDEVEFAKRIRMKWLIYLVWTGLVLHISNAILVKVEQGTLQGAEQELVTGDGTYYSFKGIPYAKAPIGDLRFRAPRPPSKWAGLRNATAHGSKCYQFDLLTNTYVGSEDCLFLNVYTPPNLNPDIKYPVIVFLHGGAWIFGSGDSDLYSPDFLMPHNVILVTLNYRLEVLGFLSLQNEDVPGNNGLKDQVAALRWVKKNIARFGGDPNSITLYGQSAGAISIGFHLFSPMSTNLFKRAIITSGSIVQDSAMVEYPRERAFALGRSLGLTTTDDKQLLKFLKTIPMEQLVRKSFPLTGWETLGNFVKVNSFAPVVETVCGLEERFLDATAEQYLRQEKIPNDVDILMGNVNGEGIFVYFQYSSQYDLMNEFDDYFLTRKLAFATTQSQGLDLGRRIKKKYLGDTIASNATIPNELISKYFGFSEFVYNSGKFLELTSFSQYNRYYYYFTAITERVFLKQILGPPTPTKEACHFDDALYIISGMNVPLNTSSISYTIIQEMTLMLTNFAKYGNPIPDDSCLGVAWKPWTTTSQDYLEISNEGLIPRQRLEVEQFAFWDGLYSEVSSGTTNEKKCHQ